MSVAVITKGVIMALLTLTVIRSHHLTIFEQGLIITTVGATITGLFTIIGARMATRKIAPLHNDVTDVKRKIGADNRVTDEPPGE